jgi:hypothetical protein
MRAAGEKPSLTPQRLNVVALSALNEAGYPEGARQLRLHLMLPRVWQPLGWKRSGNRSMRGKMPYWSKKDIRSQPRTR